MSQLHVLDRMKYQTLLLDIRCNVGQVFRSAVVHLISMRRAILWNEMSFCQTDRSKLSHYLVQWFPSPHPLNHDGKATMNVWTKNFCCFHEYAHCWKLKGHSGQVPSCCRSHYKGTGSYFVHTAPGCTLKFQFRVLWHHPMGSMVCQ